MDEISILELTKKFVAKELSPVEYAKDTIDKLKNDKLNCILAYDEDALIDDAKKSEKRYIDGNPLSALDGVPIGVKDIIDTKGLTTTYGCSAYVDHVPEEDAYVIKLLKKAGALTSIKTNTAQFAMGTTGETSLYGSVRNPHDPTYYTGGSSSGSAAAVGAKMLLAALGTDTGGSIRIPSSICGVVGIKPTYSLISIEGVMPLSESLDTIGVLSNTVYDNALVLKALVKYNERDWRQSCTPGIDYTKRIGESVQGAKVTLPVDLYEGCIDPEITECCMKAVRNFQKANNLIVADKKLPDLSEYRQAHQLNLSTFGRSIHIDDIINHTETLHPQVMRRLNFGTILGVDYVRTETLKHKLIAIMLDLMDDSECLLYPSTAATGMKIGEGETPVKFNGIETNGFLSAGALTWIGNFTGFPCMSIPVGKSSNGMPIGLMIMGRPHSEDNLYRIGEQILKSID